MGKCFNIKKDDEIMKNVFKLLFSGTAIQRVSFQRNYLLKRLENKLHCKRSIRLPELHGNIFRVYQNPFALNL